MDAANDQIVLEIFSLDESTGISINSDCKEVIDINHERISIDGHMNTATIEKAPMCYQYCDCGQLSISPKVNKAVICYSCNKPLIAPKKGCKYSKTLNRHEKKICEKQCENNKFDCLPRKKTFASKSHCRIAIKCMHSQHSQPGKPKTFTCHHCNFVSTSRKYVIRHLKICESKIGKPKEIKDNNCDYCDKSVNLRSSLRTHIKKKHPQYLIEWLKNNWLNKIKINCDHCSETFMSKSVLARHVGMFHTDKIESPKHTDDIEIGKLPRLIEKAMEEKKQFCQYCDKCFKYRNSLLQHAKKEHAQYLTELRSKINFYCDYCSQAFPSKKGLFRHIDYVHLNKESDFSKLIDNNDFEIIQSPEKPGNLTKLTENTAPLGLNLAFQLHPLKEDCVKKNVENDSKGILSVHKVNNGASSPLQISLKKESYLEENGSNVSNDLKAILYKDSIVLEPFAIDSDEASLQNLTENATSETNLNVFIYECKFCCKLLDSEYSLHNHMRVIHKVTKNTVNEKNVIGPSYECETCGKLLSSKDSLQNHIEIHAFTREELKCPICNKSMLHKRSLKYHMRLHTGKRPYKCDICGVTYVEKSKLARHVKRSHFRDSFPEPPKIKKFQCEYCGKMFLESHKMGLHLKNYHSGLEKNKSVCTICNASVQDLKKHLILHEKIQKEVCRICKKSYKAKQSLRRHMKRHFGEKSYKCVVCGLAFFEKDEMNRHLKRHFGEKFECVICGLAFFEKRQMNRHLQSHQGLNNYLCSVCGKGFSTKDSFIKHEGIHAIRKFICDSCNRRFYSKSHLRRHCAIHNK